MRRRDRADPTARLRSVRALPRTPAALPDLMRALADPAPDIVRAALAALVPIGGAGEAEHLRGMLLTVDLGLVPDVAATLRALADQAAVPTAVAGLEAPSLGTRMAAATALGVLGDPASMAPLGVALADPIAGVRRCALTSLAQLGPAPDVEAACAPLIGDRSVDVRVAAIDALAAVSIDADRRLGIVVQDRSARVRRALAAHVPTLSAATVAALLADRDADVRIAAVSVLARAPRSDLIEPLTALLGDDAWEVRRAACHALALAGGSAVAEALVPALTDSHPTVRAAAGNALADACGDGLAAEIEAAMGGAGPGLRRALVHALDRCPAPAALPVLNDAVEDEDADVRLAAATVLTAIGGTEARQLLRPLLGDPVRAVREAAAGGLERPPRGAP